MRDFGWNVFRQTGNIEAYLFFKEMDRLQAAGDASDEPSPDGEEDDRPDSASQ